MSVINKNQEKIVYHFVISKYNLNIKNTNTYLVRQWFHSIFHSKYWASGSFPDSPVLAKTYLQTCQNTHKWVMQLS